MKKTSIGKGITAQESVKAILRVGCVLLFCLPLNRAAALPIDSFIKLKILSSFELSAYAYGDLSLLMSLPLKYTSEPISGTYGLRLLTVSFSGKNEERDNKSVNLPDSFQNAVFAFGTVYLVHNENTNSIFLISEKNWYDVDRLLVILGPNARDLLPGGRIGPYELTELKKFVNQAKRSRQKLRKYQINRYVQFL